MFVCGVCGAEESRTETIKEVFEIDGRRVLVENIPVQVCIQCGEMSFSRETAEKVRQIVQGEAQPVGVVELELYAFA
jgi:YgiT-type zinc finger domain-containing protein